ncbi:hypothetical protein U473_08930 [Tepidibacillus decaturensis]|uniref:Uncharacterized protein n=1 Tax=Tepidibacillus decaturensis TaxID=1413211 RepID=A0A135L592_9BACI|nr:hypothetical protein U473_08930 [Tepidibacillus decaturensis]
MDTNQKLSFKIELQRNFNVVDQLSDFRIREMKINTPNINIIEELCHVLGGNYKENKIISNTWVIEFVKSEMDQLNEVVFNFPPV